MNKDNSFKEKNMEAMVAFAYDKLEELIRKDRFELDIKHYEFKRNDSPWKLLSWLESNNNYSEGYIDAESKKLEARLKIEISFNKKEVLEYCNPDKEIYNDQEILKDLKGTLKYCCGEQFGDDIDLIELGKEIEDELIKERLQVLSRKLEKAIDGAFKRDNKVRGKDDVIPTFIKSNTGEYIEFKRFTESDERIGALYNIKLVGWDKPVRDGDTDRRIAALTSLGIYAYDETKECSKCINFYEENGACKGCPRSYSCGIEFKIENDREDEIDGYWESFDFIKDDEDELNKNYW